eukprot:CAMPEP_0180803636 /NCGR_PEP_ID=MMETSP1038_2-20121128/61009_1 /TAXON_ID=632150 /ORGANISM="Azadinium spinosum, Strain 3D9" /LENGTH=214 /DNA_ID=CAMNT_0022843977 /DNA_START=37 /DNA_END=682 /DNA_ORIENTATION=+
MEEVKVGDLRSTVFEEDTGLKDGNDYANIGQLHDVLKPMLMFTVAVNKPEDIECLGLTLDFLDGVTGYICRVHDEGLMARWNQSALEDEVVVAGDYIVDVRGGASAREQGSSAPEAVPGEGRQAADSSTGAGCGTLGVDLSCKSTTNTLVIQQMREGPLMEWNRAHPERAVQLGDRILSADGVVGDANALPVMEYISKSVVGQVLTLHLSRPNL